MHPEVAALNARTEILAQLAAASGSPVLDGPARRGGECSTVIRLGEAGETPAALQTWDWHDEFADSWLVWTIEHPDGHLVHTLTEYGILAKIGVTSAGLGLNLNILHNARDGGPVQTPVHVLARSVLDTARNIGQALLNPAPAAPLDPELAALTDVLVPNEHEAAALCGAMDEPGTMAAQLARRYGCVVIVTAGPLGCFVAERGDVSYHCPAPSVPATDTTGAGDAFIGGLATRLRLGDELRAAATYAVSVASFSVRHAGTMPSYPTTADLPAP